MANGLSKTMGLTTFVPNFISLAVLASFGGYVGLTPRGEDLRIKGAGMLVVSLRGIHVNS